MLWLGHELLLNKSVRDNKKKEKRIHYNNQIHNNKERHRQYKDSKKRLMFDLVIKIMSWENQIFNFKKSNQFKHYAWLLETLNQILKPMLFALAYFMDRDKIYLGIILCRLDYKNHINYRFTERGKIEFQQFILQIW